MSEETYREEIEQWRLEADATLRGPEGWLSVAGLFWLHEGVNLVGSGPTCTITLPASAPAFVAELCLRDGVVTLGVYGDSLLLNGDAPDERPLRDDTQPPADRLSVGPIVLHILRCGERFGVRIRDPQHPGRTAFPGRRWYEPRPEYRIVARFEAYDPPRPIPITNILGDTEDELAPGAAVFELDGHEYRLDAVSSSGGRLFFNFRDRTAGQTTYGAGRFLYATAPQNGEVVLDFNRAVNPPCAFTAYATCPIPPRQNHLPIAIPAGELAPPIEPAHHPD
jgi:uncharacterized protein